MMDKKDFERFNELERKIDNGTATQNEMEERDMLWSVLELEEQQERINTAQFGY